MHELVKCRELALVPATDNQLHVADTAQADAALVRLGVQEINSLRFSSCRIYEYVRVYQYSRRHLFSPFRSAHASNPLTAVGHILAGFPHSHERFVPDLASRPGPGATIPIPQEPDEIQDLSLVLAG